MGEVNSDKKPGAQNQGLVKKGKKLSTRVDMTPVVDLAFLLLTFFMLATTFIKPQVMQLVLPEKNDETTDQPKVNEKNVLSIVLDGDNKIYWYIGLTGAQVLETNYTDTGLRKVLQEQSKANDKLVVLIKPEETSNYANLVDTLDELTINSISRYALVEIGADDKALIQAFTGGAPAQPAAATNS
jgi:biopolymer transport protein ExbD